MKIFGVLGVSVLWLSVASGCGREAAGGASTFSVRDSAGVQIAESVAPAWAEGEGWRLGATPLLQIGEADGAAEYLLSAVGNPTRTADGRIVLANGGSSEIRIYGPDGAYLGGFGRRGSGPGEFQRIGWMRLLPGATVLAYDQAEQRISLFTTEGRLVELVGPRAPRGSDSNPSRVDRALADGSLIAHFLRHDEAPGSPDGAQHDIQTVVHLARTGELLDTVVVMPPLESYRKTMTAGGMELIAMMPPKFGPGHTIAVTADRVIVGTSDRFQLHVFTPVGQLERIIRVRQEPRPVTDALLDALDQERRQIQAPSANPELRAAIDRARAELPHAPTVPFFSRALGDDVGNLWLRGYDVPGGASPAWTVFDAEGRMLGEIMFPEDFNPSHIGDDFVLGVSRDELDVQRVQLYALEKE